MPAPHGLHAQLLGRADLVKQLLEYKKYRDAADHLEWRAEDWKRRFPVHPAGIDSRHPR